VISSYVTQRPRAHRSISQQGKGVIGNQRLYRRTMFTVGPVHARDHGPICSVLVTEPSR